MNRMNCRLFLMLLCVGSAVACGADKSANPLSPLIAGPIAGVEIHAPKALEPTSAAQIAVDQQPLTLLIENANSNGVRPVSYIFEIATDSGFATKVYTKGGVAAGDNGRTSLRLPDALAAERTYYWRAKGDDGANASDYSSASAFSVFTPVVIQAPVLASPADGATLTTRKPTLVVTNALRTGPAGAIRYLFEVSATATMASASSVLVVEGTSQTNYAFPTDLPYATRFYWRVKALDPSHESAFSGIWSFVTPVEPPVVVPPPTVPPPSQGGVAVDAIDMGQATIWNSPFDMARWPITSKITAIDIRPSGVSVEFSKKDGPGRWPDVRPPGWDGDLQYTLGMCLQISGRWHCSAVIEFWHGLAESGGPPQTFALEWFYDSSRWGAMTGHQPAVGETIGFFVCAGDCRNNTRGDLSPVKERTNVVLLQMPSNSGRFYRFD